MQVISSFPITSVPENIVKRSSVYNNTSTTARNVSNFNEEMVNFLTKCGVKDVAYEQRDDDKYPWLYIFGLPCILYKNSSNTYTYFSINPALSSGSTLSSFADVSNGDLYVVFSGNPNNAFILRFFRKDTNEFVSSFVFYKFISSYTGNYYVLTVDRCALSSSFNPYINYKKNDKYVRTQISTSFDITFPDYIINDLKDIDKIKLYPYSYYGLYIPGFYRFSTDDSIPRGLSRDSIWQEEIVLGGQRFLNLSGMYAGLIALDDDDPEITEGELIENNDETIEEEIT